MTEKIKQWAKNFKQNFIGNTIFYVCIIAYIIIFQTIFGLENTITGVCMTLIISSSISNDMTGTPFKSFLWQMGVLLFMAVTACLTVTLNPFIAAVINFGTVFLLSMMFTSETGSSNYFIYLLSYAFLVFVAPIDFEGLPLRAVSMVFGAASVMFFQFILGRKKMEKISRGSIKALIQYILDEDSNNVEIVRKHICNISKALSERKKSLFGISNAGIALMDTIGGLESISAEADRLRENKTEENTKYIEWLYAKLGEFEKYVDGDENALSGTEYEGQMNEVSQKCHASVIYVQDAIQRMSAPENQKSVIQSDMSFKERLAKTFDASPVKLNNSIKLAIIVTVATLAVQLLDLQYGKWLIFTFLSLTMPYSEDVAPKAGQRIAATLIGCAIALVAFTILPESGGRTAVTMFAGYLSSFFLGYTGNYACATIGAISGAVKNGVTGFGPIATICLTRVFYICLGCLIVVFITNKVKQCYKTDTVDHLKEKYTETAMTVSEMFNKEKIDVQEYYHYIIELNVIENRLRQEKNDEINRHINSVNGKVVNAHMSQKK